MSKEQCISEIVNFIKNGEKNTQQIGVELEHFVCDENLMPANYDTICNFIKKAQKITGGEFYLQDNHIMLLKCKDYVVSLEPACQLEISIIPQEDICQIQHIYSEFRLVWDDILQKHGYKFITKGLHPLVESGQILPSEFEIIPKCRYYYMDKHFEQSGKYGKYMMRATASAQVSVDYSSMDDAMKKLRILQVLSPVISLLCEQQSEQELAAQWQKHILRTQIWNDLDPDRCGYFEGSMDDDYTFEKYATYVFNKPLICMTNENDTIGLMHKSASDYYNETGIFNVEHVLSMFFPNVRIKNFLEIRMADSMPINMVMGYAAFIKGLIYSSENLKELLNYFKNATSIKQILLAEKEVGNKGYNAEVYGKDIKEIISFLFNMASKGLNEKERKYLNELMPIAVIQYEYCRTINGNIKEHIKSANSAKEYIANSTAKYHNRVVRAMYIPKIFTKREIQTFENLVTTLYGIFNKVMAKFYEDEKYRQLFGFEKELLNLILREKTYECNIPISRIDVFYNEQTRRFNFCEFNTDGTSAMNEDRELNISLKLTKAYKMFEENYNIETFELFDTWIDEFLKIYEDYATKNNKEKTPNVAIVDFTSIGTLNEFEIFKQRFLKRKINAQICDVEDLVYADNKLKTKNGDTINAIYRRAVTTDIMKNLDKAEHMINATINGDVCLVGDFRTQIAHNKILFKILHMEQTHAFLTKAECDFIKAHVPYTTSLTLQALENKQDFAKEVYTKKDNWIIKPEDSYGSKGVHAGVEDTNEQWQEHVNACLDKGYIIQRFYNPYQMDNIDLAIKQDDKAQWCKTSNLTGLFVYNGKMCGTYSRISYDEMISTQYNEMSLPTIVVSRK